MSPRQECAQVVEGEQQQVHRQGVDEAALIRL